MRVLVPVDAAEIVEEMSAGRVEPTCYRVARPGIAEKVLVRLERLRGGPSAGRHMRLLNPDHARDAVGLWLDSSVSPTAHDVAGLLDRLPRLKQVYWQRTSLDDFDTAIFDRHGIELTTTGPLTSRWVAEANVACIVTDLKLLARHARRAPRRPWPFVRTFESVHVAVIGGGRIGLETGRLCRLLGMSTQLVTRTPSLVSNARAGFDRYFSLSQQLPEALEGSDYAVLALPLTRDTRGLISRNVLGAVKPGSVLINLARPEIVEQPALVDVLGTGNLGAAYVSRLGDLALRDRLRARRLRNLYLTHNLEAHVPEKQKLACEQFLHCMSLPFATGA